MFLQVCANKTQHFLALTEKTQGTWWETRDSTWRDQVTLCRYLSVKERWRGDGHSPKQTVSCKPLLLGGRNPGKSVSYMGVKSAMCTWPKSAHSSLRSSHLLHAVFHLLFLGRLASKTVIELLRLEKTCKIVESGFQVTKQCWEIAFTNHWKNFVVQKSVALHLLTEAAGRGKERDRNVSKSWVFTNWHESSAQ